MHFCDLECTYSSFPDSSAVDRSRSCRTFIALYCRKRRSLVHKNLPCSGKVKAPAWTGRSTAGRRGRSQR